MKSQVYSMAVQPVTDAGRDYGDPSLSVEDRQNSMKRNGNKKILVFIIGTVWLDSLHCPELSSQAIDRGGLLLQIGRTSFLLMPCCPE
ncbi:MAG: hypothetical protein JSV11_02405 [Nitrospiraceae bacterium]|nr:MAG: hypothetical protein JSV11_02405 [Nitrospiraceae bacterium]